MSPKFLKGLYAILDRSIVHNDDWEGAAKALLDGGARAMQLRVKNEPAGRLLELARLVAGLCADAGALFVVNDRADVARAAGVALHIGQDDLPLEAARAFMGEGAIIGVSTHSMDQATKAANGGANYIGFGPVFITSTKENTLTPRGTDQLKRIVDAVDIPVIAIGGIDLSNIGRVRASGAAGAAVISALGLGGEIEKNTRELAAAWAE